ncbi:hypothetical protein ACFQ1S_20520 [Kibdelosporangium lantanae]|uniref:Uncharacterized protein n=1 Tax=Kibdelosporangium lantanae TaxID=1497396 RepID=A0ABW3MDH9_9PSEU
MDEGGRAELAGETARFGAMLAGKGLTPDQVATVMRDHVQPALDEAMRRVENGEDINAIEFGLQYPAGPDGGAGRARRREHEQAGGHAAA